MQIIDETLHSLQTLIPNMIAASKNFADDAKKGKSIDFHVLDELLRAVQWSLEAVEGLQKNNQLLEINVNAVREPLSELEEAMEAQDYILLADLLEYELAAVFEEWHTIVEKNMTNH
ncbi:hypothetical protein [Salibacterium sp. K-3]